MISPGELERALAEAVPLFGTLAAHYRRLPETRCECRSPGHCCVFLPEMTLLEALAWIRHIGAQGDVQRAALVRQFAAYFLTNPARFPGCPFRRDGMCAIYEQRTFACRAYGMWPAQSGARRTRQSREEKGRLNLMWRRYGIDLPEDPADREIDYCSAVTVCSDPAPTERELRHTLKKIYDLDKSLGSLRERFEGECHSDFSFFLTALMLGQRQAILGKFAVIKEIVQQGSDARLQKLLARVEARSAAVIPRTA